MPPLRSTARNVAMKDSWSHGDDRRERGRVDRGVNRSRRSPSPSGRLQDSDRDVKAGDRGSGRSGPNNKSRNRSADRNRPASRSPRREEVRERNRGRELLDIRSSHKTKRRDHSTSSLSKRRKSRSLSRERSHRKRSRRDTSRSPVRSKVESVSSGRPTRHDYSPSRVRSPNHKPSSSYTSHHSRDRRGADIPERRRRSPSPHRGRPASRGRGSPLRRPTEHRHRSRSPNRRPVSRHRSPSARSLEKRRHSTHSRRRSPDIDRYEPNSRSKHGSPFPKGTHTSRGSSPAPTRGGRSTRDDYQPGSRPDTSLKAAEKVPGTKTVEGDMSSRGNFGHHQGYSPNPNQQMQAAFPLKPQFNQGPPRPQVDTRQYSQSPQHMTPNSSYHGSPQAQSPYSAGRGGWTGPQQQYSPPQQYGSNYAQGGYPPANGPQGHYYPPQNHSPQYAGPVPSQQQPHHPQSNFRGNQRGFRGNGFNSNRAGFRGGGRGGHFQNLHWNANNTTGGAGRGQQNSSGNVTPQHVSPPFQQSASQQGSPQQALNEKEDDDEDLFRPSKDLQVEETIKRSVDEEAMPPPNRPAPTGPQSNKFSFAFKASSKAAITAPKPEISQKLNVSAFRQEPPATPAANNRSPILSRSIPTQPASSRSRPDVRLSRDARDSQEPPPTRKIKKIMKRLKSRPTLPPEFSASDSVYFRKPGNESVVGSGTYGKVFKAIHVYTKKLVALKKIRMEGERDGFPVTAVREIKLLQSLKHDNIVTLQEVMVEKNDCFMVFEYLSHDLTGLLNHPTFKLDPAHKKHLAKQLFEGLEYLHRRGVLHRDIKAANILVSNEGQLKLADFGLARFYAKRHQLDYTNRVITIWYRSPELLLGETQYGPAVDIWSAACVLVEIFTRHAIFPGDGGEISQLEKIYAILGTPNVRDWPGLIEMAWFELLRPTAKRPNVFAEKYKDRVTPAAYELLEAMFQYDPAKRPTASDVLEHPYFTTEEPAPKQAIELQTLEGDWHEFESKALRKENERKDKEARRALQKEAATKEKEKKRAPESESSDRETKRQQVAPPSAASAKIAEPVTT